MGVPGVLMSHWLRRWVCGRLSCMVRYLPYSSSGFTTCSGKKSRIRSAMAAVFDRAMTGTSGRSRFTLMTTARLVSSSSVMASTPWQ